MEMEKYQIINDNLRKKDRNIILRNSIWIHYLKPVFAGLNNIPYAVIKGEVLSKLAYGGGGYRNSGDVDFLVPRSYIEQVETVLKSNCFEENIYDNVGNKRALTRQERILFRNSHQIVPYIKIVNGTRMVPVDVNTDILWGEYQGKRIDIHNFLIDTHELELYGATIKVLSDIKHFVVLCLHHYKEMNAPYHIAMGNPFTEKMFEDIYKLYYVAIHKKMDELTKFVFMFELEEIFYYILFYTSIVFQDCDMKAQAEIFKTPDGVMGLNYYGLTDKERKQWSIPFAERMNHPNIFAVIEKDMTKADIEKINMALSIF